MTATGGDATESDGIGTLNEGSLHAAIKKLVAEPGDRFEVSLDRFVIDVVRDDLLIEIQTSSFGAMGRKLDHLLTDHRIHLIHPIATETRLVRDGKPPRRSPKRGSIHDVFAELVSLPTLLDHPNLTLEIILLTEDKVQQHDPKGRRGRGGWRTVDRQLRDIVDRRIFAEPADLLDLVPDDLPRPWTTADLATQARITRRLAQAAAYCLRANELIVDEGRFRDGVHYRFASDQAAPT